MMTSGKKKVTSKSEGREWGVGSICLGFRFFGVPQFSVQRSQNTYFRGLSDLWSLDRKSRHSKNAEFNHNGSNLSTAILLNEVSERSRGI